MTGSIQKAIYCLFFLFSPVFIWAQAQQVGGIKGKITSSDGAPVPYVTVSLKHEHRTVLTGDDGSYTIRNVKPGDHTLIISHTSLHTREQLVHVTAGETAGADLTLYENSDRLQEVILVSRKSLNHKPVSIGKLEIPPMDLPQSITIVGENVMKDQQAQRLSDVVKNVNGVYLATTRGSVQESFSARGYSFGAYNMFKNGSRVNSGVMPEISGLERVEILKGSAAILYGNVAPGGILNMVTKQPKFTAGGEISMRVGSNDLYKPSFDIYGPLSPKMAYRLNGTYEKAGSYRSQVHSTRYYINPSVLYQISDRTCLLLEGDYLYHNFTPDFGIGSYDNTKIPNVGRRRFYGTPWQYNKAQQYTGTATLRHHFRNDWQLNTILSYQRYDRDYYSTERIQAQANGNWARPLNKIKSSEDYFVGQVNVTGKFNTGALGHILLSGVDAERYNTQTYAFNNITTYDTINIFDAEKYTPRTDIPPASATRLSKTPIRRFGAYVQDLISINDKIKLLAGIRWSYQDALKPDTLIMANGSHKTGSAKTDKAFTPRIGVVYKPTDRTSVFASYANSFSVNSGTDIYGNALSPSMIDQFEAGIKNDFAGGILSANVTAYRIINNNLAQTAQFTATGSVNNNTSLKELTGQTTSDGVEVDLAAHPIPGMNIIAGYSYNYMRYTKTQNKTGNYVQGQRLVNSPAHTANASIFYQFSQGRFSGWKLGATAVYIGQRVGGWNNTIGQSQGYDRRIPVDGFVTVDLSAGYTFRKITLLAKISNIANTYNVYVHENYSINPIPPRQVVATVSYKLY
jgi:iron complex outermembrane receptor protein